MFFFFFNKEHRIGFKKLSQADLGLKSTSHQTHIGLYMNVLSFLKNSDVMQPALFIYDDYSDILPCYFDRIHNPNDTFRSPKIKSGKSGDSIARKIREITSKSPELDWYLIWSSFDNNQLVFILTNNELREYEIIHRIFPKSGVYTDTSPNFNEALTYLEHKIESVTIKIQKEIEVASQIGEVTPKFSRKNLEKAENEYRITGRIGEELINEYLDKEKALNHISSFIWENKSRESGKPYDFCIDKKLFVDVKSTKYDFEQKLFFSSQEIDFVSKKKKNHYAVYRVYDLKNEQKKFKICRDCLSYMTLLHKTVYNFQSQVNSQKASLQSIKLGIQASECFLTIEPEINL